MTVQRVVFAFAGSLILLSLALALTVSMHFLWVTAFVGANLLQSAFTRRCLLASILRKAGVPDAAEPAWRSGTASLQGSPET